MKKVIDLLFSYGAELNVKNERESTPLLKAIAISSKFGDKYELANMSYRIVESLLRHGAEFNN